MKTGSNKLNDKSPVSTKRTFLLCFKALFLIQMSGSHGNRLVITVSEYMGFNIVHTMFNYEIIIRRNKN